MWWAIFWDVYCFSLSPAFRHRPKAKREKALQAALDQLYGDVTPAFGGAAGGKPEPDEKAEDDSPYVINKFNPYLTT